MTTITLPRATVQRALDALTGKTEHRYFGRCPSAGAHDERDPRCPACKTATELRAALEQPCTYPACPYPCPDLPDCKDAQGEPAELLACMVAGAAATADRTSELEALLAEARGALVGAANYIDNLGGVSISYRQHIARIDAALGGKP